MRGELKDTVGERISARRVAATIRRGRDLRSQAIEQISGTAMITEAREAGDGAPGARSRPIEREVTGDE